MRAIDTNVLIRLLTRDDPVQFDAAQAFVGNGAWVSMLVLQETVWVLTTVFSFSTRQLAIAIEMLLDHRDLMLQDPETVTAALSAFRRKPALGFTDCLILEVARRAGHLPLGTFDNALGRLDGAQRL